MNPWLGVGIYCGIGVAGWLLSFVCFAGWPGEKDVMPSGVAAIGLTGMFASFIGLGAAATWAAILLGELVGKR